MKTKKLTIEAQQICLQNVTEVFECLVKRFTEFEENGLFRDEPVLEMEPYNRGYQIKVDAWFDYTKEDADKLPAMFRTPFLHPGTFFQDYLEEGKDASMEFGYISPDQFSGQTTGKANVCTIGQFKAYATAWCEGMKKQIEEL